MMSVILAAALGTAAAVAQELPETGIPTDVMQTGAGELRIKPLEGGSLLLSWSGRQIYVDPQSAKEFQGWPKADLIVLSTPANPRQQGAVAELRKAATVVVAAGGAEGEVEIPAGGSRTVTLPGEGKPVQVRVQGAARRNGGEAYMLELGGTRVLLAGATGCGAAVAQSGAGLGRIAVAFVAIGPEPGLGPRRAAACLKRLRPKIAYPMHGAGNAAELLRRELAGTGLEVRIRSW